MKSLRYEGDENKEQFSNTVIQRGVVICWYLTEVKRDRRRSV
jgi:hypothetical protein